MSSTFKYSCSIYFFYAITLAVIIFTFKEEIQKGPHISPFAVTGKNHQELAELNKKIFKDAKFYVTQEKNDRININASAFHMNPYEHRNYFKDFHGTYFQNKKEGPVFFKGQEGHYFSKKKTLDIKGNVHIKTDTYKIFTHQAKYDLNKAIIDLIGKVQSFHKNTQTNDIININSKLAHFKLKSKDYSYLKNVTGIIRKTLDYEPPMYFKSDKLQAKMNDQHIQLSGNVLLEKQELKATSRIAEIFLKNYNKRIKYYSLSDDVKILEKINLKDGKRVERKAFSEKLEGFIKEKKIILSGSPKVIQGEQIIKGNTITLTEQNDLIEVDGSNSRLNLKDSL